MVIFSDASDNPAKYEKSEIFTDLIGNLAVVSPLYKAPHFG